MSEPERWLTSADAPGPMRDMLAAAQKVGPSTLERAALAGKLGVATSGLWIAPALKGLAATAVVAGGVWLAATAGSPSSDTGAALAPAPQTTSASRGSTPNTETLKPVESASSPVDLSPEVEREATSAPVVKSRVAKAPPEIKKPSETSLIAGARKSLDTSPGAALGLLTEHAKLYPSGVLAEEREVLRIRALRNLGRATDAEIQEEKFHKEHPASLHHVP